MKKDPAKQEKLNTVMAILAQGIKFTGGMLTPFMPETAHKIWETLGCGDEFANLKYSDLANPQPLTTTVQKPEPLFPKIVE